LAVGPEDSTRSDVQQLVAAHLAFARGNSPPEDVHAVDTDRLGARDMTLFGVREGGRLLGIGALKQLDASHAEIKSMHTAAAARGRGVGRLMLEHLLHAARARGCDRVSLETGTMDAFAPARALYAAAGFVPCEPFGDYWVSPNSVCMTLVLGQDPEPASQR
jgi:putative acetyltransferase